MEQLGPGPQELVEQELVEQGLVELGLVREPILT
jgi:hypothetical protein